MYRLVDAGSRIIPSDIGAEHLRDVARHDRITVDVDCAAVLRIHKRNKQSVVSRLGIIITNRQLVCDLIHRVFHIDKFHDDMLGAQALCVFLVLFLDAGAQNIDMIPVFL